jgi:hypothetical protein
MTMGEIDRRPVLSMCRTTHARSQVGLLDGKPGINKNSILLPKDERSFCRRKHPSWYSWREVGRSHGDARSHEHIPTKCRMLCFDSRHTFVSFMSSTRACYGTPGGRRNRTKMEKSRNQAPIHRHARARHTSWPNSFLLYTGIYPY